MNREIKYRALLDGVWCYSDSQADAKKLGAKLGSSIMAAFMNRFYGDPTLSQCIGLLGKNERQVYEGDIIRSTVGHEGIDKRLFRVCYNEHQACFGLRDVREDDRHFYGFTPFVMIRQSLLDHNLYHLEMEETIEVVGNIHQHPELMGTAKGIEASSL